MVVEGLISKINNTIQYTADFYEAIIKLAKNNANCIILLRNNKPFGVLTIYDVLELLYNKANVNIQVSSVADLDFIKIPKDSSAEYIYKQTLSFECDYFIVVDEKEEFYGYIEREKFLSSRLADKIKTTKLLSEVCEKKIPRINLPYSFEKLLYRMYVEKHNAFFVENEDKIEGIITVNDIVRYVDKIDSQGNIVKLFEQDFLFTSKDDNIQDIIELMRHENKDFIHFVCQPSNEHSILSFSDLVLSLRAPNEILFESKIKANHALIDKLNFSLVEAVKIGNDFVVSWLNVFAKKTLNLKLNAKIKTILPQDMIENILRAVEKREVIGQEMVEIRGKMRKVNMSYTEIADTTMLKILIEELEEKEGLVGKEDSHFKATKQKSLYNDIFYQKSIGIAYMSIGGTILDVNPYIEKLLGYSKDEMKGLNYYDDIVYKEDRDNAKKSKANLLKKYIPDSVALRRYIRKDGSLVWVLLSTNVLYDTQGEVKYLMSFLQDYTKYYEARENLVQQKEILSTIFDTVEDFVFYKDADLKYVSCNQAMLDFLDMEQKDIIGKTNYDIFSKEQAEKLLDNDRKTIQKREKFTFRQSVRRDNKEMIVETNLKPHFGKEGNFLGIIGIVHNLTFSVKYEERQRLMQNLFKYTDEGIVITNRENIVATINPAFTKITGYNEDDIVGKKPSLLASGKHDAFFYKDMWKSIQETGSWRGEVWNKTKKGLIYPQLLTISAIRDEDGKIVNFVGIFSDITEFKESQAKLEFLAHHDPLTKLPNRTSFEMTLENAIKRANRDKFKVGILFFDLDNFKEINDTYGHSLGDNVLVQVAKRVRKILRESDVVSRIGGDEFVVLLEGFYLKSDLDEIINKIFHIFHSPFIVEDKIFNISSSLGVAVYPEDGLDKETLIKNADVAMYQAKKMGKNNFRYYTSDLTNALFEKVETLADIRRAIKNEEFTLFYQPQFDLATDTVVGAEALARWEHPIKGLIFPDSFITLAEESQFIIQIGRQLFKKACKDIRRWQDMGLNLDNFKLAINISAVQVLQDNLLDMVQDVSKEIGIDTKFIELELTETSIMRDPDGAIELFNNLKKLGITLSIDDFGTGYSSLSYLKRFAIDKIKIDRSFIMDIPYDKDDIAITKAVIALSSSMGLEVIAEGIEDKAQKLFLLEEGCGKGQGYFYSKPIHVKDFEELFLKKKTIH